MDDLISREALFERTVNNMKNDLISRRVALEAVEESRRLNHHQDGKEACAHEYEHRHFLKILMELPSAQPFHNITMNDVLKYIDGMPEDVWQEFTACLECRGWELQRRTAKWYGSDFA